jgi:DNA-binding MarR family transcriptional regulator
MTSEEFLNMMRPTFHLGMFTNRQMGLLSLCASLDEPIQVTQAALRLKISKPALSRGIDRLSRAGLVKRKRNCDEGDAEDLRKTFVQITPEGRSLLAKMGVA